MSLFFAAGMRDGRKFEGGMQDLQGVCGRREVGHFHGGTRELLIFSCEKRDVRRSKLEFKFTAEIPETETTFLETEVSEQRVYS